MISNRTVPELAAALQAADIPPRLAPTEAALLLAVLRMVATGRVVAPAQLSPLAASLAIPPDRLAPMLRQMAEYDEHGNIIGMLGLSQAKHPHRFHCDGHPFTTWCAWDTLFLPILLQAPAQIETTCPATQRTIRLTVTPDGVLSAEPAGAVLLIVVPPPAQQHITTVEQRWSRFCHHVWLFTTQEAAEQWPHDKPYDAVVLSLEDGFVLGRQVFADLLQSAQSAALPAAQGG